MSHLIDTTTGRNAIAYVGQKPWHGLGTELTPKAPIKTWLIEAGLNWEILSADVTFVVNDQVHVIPNRRALYRSDTNAYLSTMSHKHYNVVQPSEILEFYRELVTDNGLFQLETAGSIDEGKKIWAMARYKNHVDMGGDIVKPYVLLVTSCDGSLATTAMFTTVRVVCNNTLQFSLNRDDATSIKVGHRSVFNGDDLKQQLGLVPELDKSFESEMRRLVERQINDGEAKDIFFETYALRNRDGEVKNERFCDLTTVKLMEIMHNGPGAKFETARNTAWGVVNAVTHFEDHHRRSNNKQNVDNNRFKSAQFGDGAAHKARVLELLAA